MSGGIITSRANALIRQARAVRAGKARELIFIEGVRLCEEAAGAALSFEDVLYTEKLARDERGARLLKTFGPHAKRMTTVAEDVLASVSDTKTPQGIIALAGRPRTDRATLERRVADRSPLLVIMHRVNNPANAGAMLRVAEAAGASGAIATRGTTDLFSPKALRGAMGSSFRLPLWTEASFVEVVDWCAARGIRTVGTDARAERAPTEVDWRAPHAVICGAEAGGLLAAEADLADFKIRIPMRAPVESLNVAVALAVVLYEAARQRAGNGPIY